MKLEPKSIEDLIQKIEIRNCLKLCSVIQQNFMNEINLVDLRDAAAVMDVTLISDFSEISDVFTIRVSGTKDNNYIGVEADPVSGRVLLKATYNVNTGLIHTMYCMSNNSPVLSIVFGVKNIIVNSKSYTYDELESKLFQFSTINNTVNLDFFMHRISANVHTS